MEIGGKTIRAFVVTVPGYAEKTAFILNHFREVGLQVEQFDGVNGIQSGLNTIYPYENDAPGSGWNIGTKGVATWVSFYMLWKAMQFMPEDYFMTLEWDAKFGNGWKERMDRAVQDVPSDFDLLLVGSCCADKPDNINVKGEVFKVRYPMCGHATIVAKKALPVMIATQTKVYAPLDISLMFHTMPLLQVYTVLPRIADQWNTHINP